MFQRFRELFERYDVLLTPAAPVKPFPVEMNFPSEINGRKFDNYVDWIAPTFLITLVSLPAGSVPAGLTRDGLPVGLQVVAPRFEEPRILSVDEARAAGQSDRVAAAFLIDRHFAGFVLRSSTTERTTQLFFSNVGTER